MSAYDAEKGESKPVGALHGVRVLDIATFIAAPFCGTILADFGAEVIKIEHPETGDALRHFGTATECGDSLVWLSESRNKKTMSIDLRKVEGAALFRALVAKSDVVLENFRPGTLEKWGLGYEDLRKINPNIVMLRVSAYGQTGPKSHEPGFARIAHAFGGLSYLAGEAGRPPVIPGSTSLADYLSGMWGAIGVLLALRARDRLGHGQYIDIGLYESVFRVLDEIAPAYAKFGIVRERMGADTVNVCPHSHYQTQSGEWVAIACTSDKMWQRMANALGKPELAETLPTAEIRVAHRDEVNALVANWIGSLTFAEVMEETARFEVPCGPIYSIADIFRDAQYAARENLEKLDDPRAGELVLPSAMPRLSETPAILRHAGRERNADTDDILGEVLGLTEQEIDALRSGGVI
ncbi:CaiB/BaiF CoA transferase family protein [Xanthobacter sp. TB0139]|uniref:CaiB/BaiF CoA transferase family protein n=1 Tax=Xanthobacter sp. TB0139 TaxID=3459178 RepID=UPI0040399D45